MHDLRLVTRELVEGGRTLSTDQAHAAIGAMLDGGASDVEISSLLTALATRGETAEELCGVVHALRERLLLLPLSGAERAQLVDTCGTGGDGAGTFNISTAAALVAAAAGARVAKHGNRAVTSRCGSADVLEAMGVRVDLEPAEATACLRQNGFVFLFAPGAHPTMRRVQPVRRALGFRNIFHMAGPLSNPAGAQAQVMGVFARNKVDVVAQAMAQLGVRHGLVVHGADGLDELTVTGPTAVAEVRDGATEHYEVTPEQVGLKRAPAAALLGAETAAGNAVILEDILRGSDTSAEAGPRRDVVLLNAAACLLVAGIAVDLREGVAQARTALEAGAAWALLERLCVFGSARQPQSDVLQEQSVPRLPAIE